MNVSISTSHILKADREQGVSALDTGDEHSWIDEALASLIRFLCGVEQVNELQREWPQLLVAPQSQKL